jgi:hypothetical protein
VCLCIIGLSEDGIAQNGLATNVKRLRTGYIRAEKACFLLLNSAPMLTGTEQYFCVIPDDQKKGKKIRTQRFSVSIARYKNTVDVTLSAK